LLTLNRTVWRMSSIEAPTRAVYSPASTIQADLFSLNEARSEFLIFKKSTFFIMNRLYKGIRIQHKNTFLIFKLVNFWELRIWIFSNILEDNEQRAKTKDMKSIVYLFVLRKLVFFTDSFLDTSCLLPLTSYLFKLHLEPSWLLPLS